MNTVNNDKSIPPVSGQNSEVSYTFSNWNFDIFLQTPDYSSTTPNLLGYEWLLFQFTFQWHYHMEAKSWPNPSESGYIYVWTQNWNQKMLSISSTITNNGGTPTYNCDGVQIVANDYDIYIYVSCSDTFCLIPVDDIAQSVAKNFLPTFQTEMQKTLNLEFNKILSDILLLKKIQLEANAEIILDLEGAWSLLPDGSHTPGILISPTGMFLSDVNNNIVNPPFQDNYTVPANVLNNPPRELMIYVTPFFLETSFWAVNYIGFFNRTLTDADVPSSSPVHLDTNDGFFQSAAPGLTKYPNLNLTVSTSFSNTPYFYMNTTGLYAYEAKLELEFNIVNESKIIQKAFAIQINLNLNLNSSLNQIKNKFFLNSTIINHSEIVTTTFTNVGPIVSDAFSQLVDLIFSIITFPGFALPIPPSLTISAQELAYGPNYLQIGMNYAYNLPQSEKVNPKKFDRILDINNAHHYKLSSNSTHIDIKPAQKISKPNAVQLCGDGSANCASGSTCCKTSTGTDNIKYGCCPYPNAVCCGSACETCCPNGYMCYTNCECGNDQGKLFESHYLIY